MCRRGGGVLKGVLQGDVVGRVHKRVCEESNDASQCIVSPFGLASGLVGLGITSFNSLFPPTPPDSPDRPAVIGDDEDDSFHFIFPTLSRTVAPRRISRKGETPT